MAEKKQLNVALIGGAGFMGRAHSYAWALASMQSGEGIRINKAVVVEREQSVAQSVADRFEWVEADTDWRRVVDRVDVDIVDVVTPPDLHAEIVCYALERGKHVLCEKPITNSREESNRMIAAARASNARTAIGFNYRHNAAIQYAAQLISEGTIGKVLQVRFEYHQDDAFSDMGWRRYKASGGSGASSDIGSHIIDLATLLIGDITDVSASLMTVPASDDDDHDVDDGGAFFGRFENGAFGIFSFSQKSHGNFAHFRFEIDGAEGGIAFDWNARDVLRVYRGTVDAHGQGGFVTTPIGAGAPGVWFGSTSLGTGYLEPSTNLMVEFVKGIVEPGHQVQDLAHGARIQSVVDAVWASAETDSRWTPVDYI